MLQKTRSIFLSAAATSILCASCYSFIGRYEGDKPFMSDRPDSTFEQMVEDLSPDSEQLAFVLADDDALRAVDSKTVDVAGCMKEPALLRFVWFSDVQMRQQEVKLFSKNTSATLDNVIPTFEHNMSQEDFDWAVYLSLVKAANSYMDSLKEAAPQERVQFMIHTGDAMDAGTIEELYQFVWLTNKLKMPWFNAIGNHDNAIFGNYKEDLAYTKTANVSFYPVGNNDNFLFMHNSERQIGGFGPDLLPIPLNANQKGIGVAPILTNNKSRVPTSRCHGFDMGHNPDNKICSTNPGYYSFDLTNREGDDSGSSPFKIIVLNTTKDEQSWGANAYMDAKQVQWLQDSLNDAKTGGRFSLVFAHHRPIALPKKARESLKKAAEHGLLFFSGHTHKHHIDWRDQAFYELNTGSIIEYPQVGRVITVRGSAGSKGCLTSRVLRAEILPLKTADTPDQTPPLTAEIKKELKDCREWRSIPNSLTLKQAVSCGHHGSLADYWSGRKRLEKLGRPQTLGDALKAANIVLPLDLQAIKQSNQAAAAAPITAGRPL